MLKLNVRNCAVLSLLGLLLLMQGCGTTSVPLAIDCPTPPPKPRASQPAPAIPYSASLRLKLEEFRKRLMGTPATPEPATNPGQTEGTL